VTILYVIAELDRERYLTLVVRLIAVTLLSKDLAFLQNIRTNPLDSARLVFVATPHDSQGSQPFKPCVLDLKPN